MTCPINENCADSIWDDGYCIFHSPDAAKNPQLFLNAFQIKDIGNFSEFIFPVPLEPSMFSANIKEEGNYYTIKKPITFKSCTFSEGINLSDSIFIEDFALIDCKLNRGSYICRNRFQKRALIEDMNLINVSFSDTDIGSIDFQHCRWTVNNVPSWRASSQIIIYDEIEQKLKYAPIFSNALKLLKRIFHETDNSVEPEGKKLFKTLELYRAFRKNYENVLRYPEAGEFHIGEMEMRRLALFHNRPKGWCKSILSIWWVEYFVLWLYKCTSIYGERYTRALGSLVLVVFIFSILYMFAGIKPEIGNLGKDFHSIHYSLDLSGSFKWAVVQDWFKSFAYSFSAATLFLKNKAYKYETPNGFYLYIIESLFGAMLLPVLVIAIRRKFRRSRGE